VAQQRITVLVLGVGGNVSQGILKALALSRLSCRVVGAALDPMKWGLYTVDRACVSPRADDPGFPDWLAETCVQEGVQAVLSGAEPVLHALAQQARALREKCGAVTVVSEPDVLATGDDKLLTSRWLERHGFAGPPYAASEDEAALQELASQFGLPLIAKRRNQGGSRDLIHIRDESDLAYVAGKPGYAVQQHVGDEDSEYTVGCFCDRDGRVRGAIAMRRRLHEGTTVEAEVGEFPAVREEAIRIAQALRPTGPCNVQCRLVDGRPTCFEINVRFSGTTPVRARLGFNEVEEALRHFVLGEPARDLPLVTTGLMIRYWNETYLDEAARQRLEETGRLEDPHGFRLLTEDYGMRL